MSSDEQFQKCAHCGFLGSRRALSWHWKKNPDCAHAIVSGATDTTDRSSVLDLRSGAPTPQTWASNNAAGGEENLTEFSFDSFFGASASAQSCTSDQNPMVSGAENPTNFPLTSEDNDIPSGNSFEMDNELESESDFLSSDSQIPQHDRVCVPSTIPLPDPIKEAMHSPPPNFGPDYLFDITGTKDGISYGNGVFDRMGPRDKSDILLLHILRDHDLGLFKKIKEWRSLSHYEYCDVPEPIGQNATRNTVVNRIQKYYGFQHLRAKKTSIVLPCTGVRYDLRIFPFGHHLASLLTNPVAMQPKNSSLDTKNPHELRQEPTEMQEGQGTRDDCYGDFSTGDVHKTARKIYCQRDDDVLCEITLFIDRTFLDVKGKHTVEPVMFTLGIFNRAFRNRPEAWRPLGYLPNMNHLAPHHSAEEKNDDYHFCLRLIMSELVKYQELNGIKWTLVFHGKEFPCRLQIPVNCIIGDSEGHDKLLNRSIDRQGKDPEKGLCRYCNIPFSELDKPLLGKSYKLTKCTYIRKLRNNPTDANCEKLRMLSYKKAHDGMVEVHFSDPKRGLHGMTPGEVLHLVQEGLILKTHENCFGAKKMKKKGKKARAKKRSVRDSMVPQRGKSRLTQQTESDQDQTYEFFSDVESNNDQEDEAATSDEEEEGDDTEAAENNQEDTDYATGIQCDSQSMVMEAPTSEDLSTRGVFPRSVRQRIDDLAMALHCHLRWQSDSALPRTTFPMGLTFVKKMQGHERPGALLVLLIALVMDFTVHTRNWLKDQQFGRRGTKRKRKYSDKEPGSIEESLGTERSSNYIKAISLLLQFERFMRAEFIKKSDLPLVEPFVPVLIDQLMRAFPRSGGMSYKTLKDHLVAKHVPSDIVRFGSCQNFNSGPGEHLHVSAVKKPGKQTQKRKATFEEQVGNRFVEALTISRSYLDHPQWREAEADLSVEVENDNEATYHSPILHVGIHSLKGNTGKKHNGIPVWPCSPLSCQDLVTLCREKIIPQLEGHDQISVYGRTKRGMEVFCCHPCYGSERASRQNWAMFEFEGEPNHFPCHILAILEIPVEPSTPITIGESTIDEKGYYCLVHCSSSPLLLEGEVQGSLCCGMYTEIGGIGTLAHPDSTILHRISKWRSDGQFPTEALPPTLMALPCESIAGPCTAFPDIMSDNVDNEFFVLASPSEWAELFVEHARRHKRGDAT